MVAIEDDSFCDDGNRLLRRIDLKDNVLDEASRAREGQVEIVRIERRSNIGFDIDGSHNVKENSSVYYLSIAVYDDDSS